MGVRLPQRQTAARARVSAGDCGCGSPEFERVSFGVRERPRYYARQLMTPDDLLLEADYFRDRLRRHNIFLHGWGVVCGALVCVVKRAEKTRQQRRYERQSSALNPAAAGHVAATNGNGDSEYEPWLVRVEPGYILGPYGDEILIEQPVDVPLRGSGVSGCGSDSGDDLADPWCSEVFVDRRESFFLAIRYKECPARLVRSQPVGCGCDDVPCEYSRYRDGFEIGFLDCCPDDQAKNSWQPHEDAIGKSQPRNPPCPDCPASPWVVLAEIALAANGDVTSIDNCSCRRIMISDRNRWGSCSGSDCDHPNPDANDHSATEAAAAEAGHETESLEPALEPKPPTRSRTSGKKRSSTPPSEEQPD